MCATFNNTSDRSDGESSNAARYLNHALSDFYSTLAHLENDMMEAAANSKNNALHNLDQAISYLELVVEIELDEQLTQASLETDYYAAFETHLGEVGIPVPTTRKNLARVGLSVTETFRQVLSEMPIDDLRAIQNDVHGVIRKSLELQEIGMRASSIWLLQLPGSGIQH